jgi:GCN5-like N-acetyltransferase
MTLFELKFLEPAKDYTSPFPHDPEGFTDTWWIPNIDMPYYDDLGGTKLIQFLVDHVEVGRAKITDWCLSTAYIGINSEINTKQIWFFEIHQNARRKGYGTEFAKQLINIYPDVPLIAFSENADDFWSRIGWIYYPRKDGDKHCGKLFISKTVSS